MLITLLLKLFSLPKLLRLHFYPLFNRVLLKAHGVQSYLCCVLIEQKFPILLGKMKNEDSK